MKIVKRFFKELKRVKWPTASQTGRAYSTILLFVIITSLVLFGLAIGLIQMWEKLGVGV